jgi:hypothetical protein
MKTLTLKQKQDKAFETMKEQFGYKNKLASPHVQKVVVSVGTGSRMKKDRNTNTFVVDRITKITGQKPSVRKVLSSQLLHSKFVSWRSSRSCSYSSRSSYVGILGKISKRGIASN